jgi:hypothetical protein
MKIDKIIIFITLTVVDGKLSAIINRNSNGLSDRNWTIALQLVLNRVFSNDSRTNHLKMFTKSFHNDEFLNHQLSTNPVIIERGFSLQNIKKYRNIFIINTIDDFSKYHANLIPSIYNFHGEFLIIMRHAKFNEMKYIFEIMWRLFIYNVNIIYQNENNDEIMIATFIPFNPNKCDDLTPIVINRIIDENFVNSTSNFFPNKMKNLHGCEIKVALPVDYAKIPFTMTKMHSNGSEEFYGSDFYLIENLAKYLNFKLKINRINASEYLYENGSASGSFRDVMDGRSHFLIGSYWLTNLRQKFMDATIAYYFDSAALVIPPGSQYTSFERLIYPFDVVLWISLIIVYGIGILFIAIVKRMPSNTQNFIFGENVKSPFMNLWAAIIGTQQTHLPRHNFARFVLMIFLLFSLVIRTGYQGSLFELLRSNKFKNGIQTLSELREKNFKVYIPPSMAGTFGSNEIIGPR